MTDRINLEAVRAVETHRTGPWPWDEGAASSPKCEIEHATLLAFVEVVEAARKCWRQVPPNGTDRFQVAAHDALRDALARFDFGAA